MGKVPRWLEEMFQRQAAGVETSDAMVWSAGGGDAVFRGTAERDVLWLDGLTLQQLREGLRLDPPAARLRVEGNGTVGFRDAAGIPVIAAGVLAVGHTRLRFSGIARFAFVW
jgi:hypothetical protein